MKRTIALLLASVLLFAAALALGSCEKKPTVPLGGGPAGAGNAARMGYALAEPVDPEFPQRPEMPGEEDLLREADFLRGRRRHYYGA